MEKFIAKSIDIARSLFEATYDNSNRYQTFHFCFAWNKNRLLAIGQNRVDVPSPKVIYFANKFKSSHNKKFPYPHAEIDCISRLWGRFYIDNSVKIVVLRLNSHGQLQNSKPCKNCMTVLEPLGVRVWYSNSDGEIERL